MPRLRTAAALAAITALPLCASAPAHAALNACVADVSISSIPSGEFNANVSATLTGSCLAVGHHDEITCDVYLVGALGVLASNEVIGTTDGGCTVGVSMFNGLQATPYVAVGVVYYRLSEVFPLPGVDVDARLA